jgi:putative ABC transport system permease protein
MKSQLEKFAYRMELTMDIFVVIATAKIVITAIAVSFQTIKAGLMNPVNSLRNE